MKLKITKAENTEISLSEILQVVPELKTLPKEVLTDYKLEAIQLYENRIQCKNCTKQGENVFDCWQLTPEIKDGSFYFSAGSCGKQRKAYITKKTARIMEQSRIGERFKDRRFDTFKTNASNRKAYEACLSYARSFNKKSNGLLLVGEYGTGKTHLAVSIIHELAKKNVYGVFITTPDLLQKIRTSYTNPDIKANEIMDIVKTTEFLVLDDLGTEKVTDWVREQFYMIINARYENMLQTVITTNCTFKELEAEDKLGKRIVSRIIEMTDGVLFGGQDYRMRKLGGDTN